MYVWTRGKRERERNRSGRCMCGHKVSGERERERKRIDRCMCGHKVRGERKRKEQEW